LASLLAPEWQSYRHFQHIPSEVRGDIVVSVFEGDIRDSELLSTACKGASEVYHTASVIDVIKKVDYSKIHGVNVKGMTYVQESMESFIYTSSIEVAGPNANGDPIINDDENTPYPSERVTLQAQGEGNTALAHLQAAPSGNFYYISDDTPPISYFDFNRVVLSPLGFSTTHLYCRSFFLIHFHVMNKHYPCSKHIYYSICHFTVCK
uniref:3-beta hydroxysteroid dehydrogenase/isomerase domain-containing protein n=1 Tax=Oncorhynchus mykiss TaxID=8022 RepID=A0A8C7RDZ7_ONCMY